MFLEKWIKIVFGVIINDFLQQNWYFLWETLIKYNPKIAENRRFSLILRGSPVISLYPPANNDPQ